jgi:hypothetical protein
MWAEAGWAEGVWAGIVSVSTPPAPPPIYPRSSSLSEISVHISDRNKRPSNVVEPNPSQYIPPWIGSTGNSFALPMLQQRPLKGDIRSGQPWVSGGHLPYWNPGGLGVSGQPGADTIRAVDAGPFGSLRSGQPWPSYGRRPFWRP